DDASGDADNGSGNTAAVYEGGLLDLAQDLTVGRDASGNVLLINNDAIVNVAGDAVIGENSGDNYIFLEQGSNAQFNVAQDLTVGNSEDGDNRFAVYGGTADIGGSLFLGASTDQHDLENYIHVETTNAVLNVADTLHIGAANSDNIMRVAAGAEVNVQNLYIGTYDGTSNNTVEVSGKWYSNSGGWQDFVTNSTLAVSGDLVIGSTNSGGNSITLQDGGILEVAQTNITIGSTNDFLTVADEGTLKTGDWDFDLQTGLATNIVFEEGSTLHLLGTLSGTNMVENGMGYVLDGAAASWSTGAENLYVGYTNDNNSLTLTNGAMAETFADLIIGYASQDNILTVGGTNSLLDIGADLYIGTETNLSANNTLNVLAGGAVNVGGDTYLFDGTLHIDSKSQVNVAGEYIQDSDSTLSIGVSSNQVSPNLVVSGNAEFAGTDDSENNPVIRIFDEGVAESNIITIVQADTITINSNSATGAKFESNIHSNVLLGFNILVTNDVDYTYIILSDFLSQSIGDGGNLSGQLLEISNEIEALADAGNSNATAMVETIRSELSTEEEIQTVYNDLYGEKVSSIPAHNMINSGVQSVNEQLFMRADTTRSRAVPQGTAGPHEAGQSLQGWISAFGSWGDKSAADGFNGYDTSLSGFMVGADLSVAENVLVGIAGGKGGASVDKDNGASADTKSIYAALYSSVGTQDWFGDFSLIYANSSVDADLDQYFGTQAEYDAQNVAFSIGAGKEMIGQYLIFTPQVSFLGNLYFQDEYTETSSGAVTREVDSFNAFYLQSAVGGSAAMYLGMGDVTLKPEFRIHWMHEWLGDDESLDYKLSGGSNNYNLQLQAPEKDIFKIGIGSSAKFGEYLELRADLDTRFGKDYSDFTLLGSLRYQF
ncbi:autotransporter domain-containing protein, partial [Pontiella sp.]|uniref:autotransporter family protein n=1 Tax=Pontiella sp. TaxID=2837462 RepID=UPI0035688A12